jgi:hypothetical protein
MTKYTDMDLVSPQVERLGKVCLKPGAEQIQLSISTSIEKLTDILIVPRGEAEIVGPALVQANPSCIHLRRSVFVNKNKAEPTSNLIFSRAFLPATLNSSNYFHLLLEFGFSVYLARQADLNIPYLIESRFWNNPLLHELARLLDAAEYIKELREVALIGNASLPSFVIWDDSSTVNLRTSESWKHTGYSFKYFSLLAKAFNAIEMPSSDGYVLLLDRADASFRTDSNSILRGHLETLDLKLKVAAPKTLYGRSIADQAELFQNAKAVVALHGASLTNLIFCKPHTPVLEILTDPYSPGQFSVISSICKLNYYPVITSCSNETAKLAPICRSPDIDFKVIDEINLFLRENNILD